MVWGVCVCDSIGACVYLMGLDVFVSEFGEKRSKKGRVKGRESGGKRENDKEIR